MSGDVWLTTCDDCDGRGQTRRRTCPLCGGTGLTLTVCPDPDADVADAEVAA